MFQKLQNYLVVTIMAVLIWLLAELRTVKNHDLLVDVLFTAPAGQQLVIEPSAPRPVQVTVQCPTGQFDLIQNMAQKGPIEVEVSDDPATMQQTVNLRQEFSDYRVFKDLGVHVLAVEPERVQLRIEAYEERTLPVAVVGGTMHFNPPPVPDPRQVSVRAPASVVAQLVDQKVEVRLVDQDLSAFEHNVPITRELPLTLPPILQNQRVTIRPQSAKVTFTIRNEVQQLTLPSVPIVVLAPPSELGRFDVKLDDEQRVLRDVKLSGPAELIEKIKKQEVDVWAQFRLTIDDLERGVTSAPLTVVAPPGVVVESPPPPVTFAIVKRQ